MSDQVEKCKIKAVHHPVKGVEFELEGDCTDTLQIFEDLQPSRRRYFMRRLKLKD